MAFTQAEIECLQIGKCSASTVHNKAADSFVYPVQGFTDDTQANLFQIGPDSWRYDISQGDVYCHSADVFKTKEEAWLDLKQWLLGEGYRAIYQDSLPDYVERMISQHIDQAMEAGWRSIQIERADNMSSDKPEDLRIRVHATSPTGVRKWESFGLQEAPDRLRALFQ